MVNVAKARKLIMLKIRKIEIEPTPVFDITVPETECFFANDILVHNCSEIDRKSVV